MKDLMMRIIMVILICQIPKSVYGANYAMITDVGTSARHIALGSVEGFSISADSVFENPAGLYRINQFSSSLFSAKVMDEVQYSNIAIGKKLPIGTIGFGYMDAKVEDIPITRKVENQYPTTGSSFNYKNSLYKLSYQTRLYGRYKAKENHAKKRNEKKITVSLDEIMGSLNSIQTTRSLLVANPKLADKEALIRPAFRINERHKEMNDIKTKIRFADKDIKKWTKKLNNSIQLIDKLQRNFKQHKQSLRYKQESDLKKQQATMQKNMAIFKGQLKERITEKEQLESKLKINEELQVLDREVIKFNSKKLKNNLAMLLAETRIDMLLPSFYTLKLADNDPRELAEAVIRAEQCLDALSWYLGKATKDLKSQRLKLEKARHILLDVEQRMTDAKIDVDEIDSQVKLAEQEILFAQHNQMNAKKRFKQSLINLKKMAIKSGKDSDILVKSIIKEEDNESDAMKLAEQAILSKSEYLKYKDSVSKNEKEYELAQKEEGVASQTLQDRKKERDKAMKKLTQLQEREAKKKVYLNQLKQRVDVTEERVNQIEKRRLIAVNIRDLAEELQHKTEKDELAEKAFQKKSMATVDGGISLVQYRHDYYTVSGKGHNIDLGIILNATNYEVSILGKNVIPGMSVKYNSGSPEPLVGQYIASLQRKFNWGISIYPQLKYTQNIILPSIGIKYTPNFIPIIHFLGGYKSIVTVTNQRRHNATIGIGLQLKGVGLYYAYERSDYILQDHKSYVSLTADF